MKLWLLCFLAFASIAKADAVDSLNWSPVLKQLQVVTHSSGTKRVNASGGASPSSTAAISANYTITDTDGYEILLVTTGSSTITLTLPAATSNKGRKLVIKKVDSGSGKITINRAGSDTIDGYTTTDIGEGSGNQYATISILGDTAAWRVISVTGERISSSVVSGSAISVAAQNTGYDITNIPLPPGDWDISFDEAITGNTVTGGTYFHAWVGTTAGDTSAGLVSGDNDAETTAVPTTAGPLTMSMANWQRNITTATTYYLKVQCGFSGGTITAYGRISGRRLR